MRYRDRLTGQTVTTERRLPASRYDPIHEVLEVMSPESVEPVFTVESHRDERGRFLPRDEEE